MRSKVMVSLPNFENNCIPLQKKKLSIAIIFTNFKNNFLISGKTEWIVNIEYKDGRRNKKKKNIFDCFDP